MRVTIYSGIPGSGKSTIIRERHPGGLVCSADHFFTRSGVYTFDPARLPEAHASCLRGFVRFLEWGDFTAGSDIVVDNTNTTAVEIAPYAALALAYGAQLEIVTVQCDPLVAAARNTHGVSLGTIERMARNLQERKLPPWWPNVTIVNG